MSDIFDRIMSGIKPAQPETPPPAAEPLPPVVPSVQTPEPKEKEPSMVYSADFEKVYGKKT